MSIDPKAAAALFTEGFRAGVNVCIKDVVAAAERLDRSGQVMPAATLASVAIMLQRHVPKAANADPA